MDYEYVTEVVSRQAKRITRLQEKVARLEEMIWKLMGENDRLAEDLDAAEIGDRQFAEMFTEEER